MKNIVIGGSNSKLLAKHVAKRIRAPYSELIVDHFPDGEIRLRYRDDVNGRHVIIVNSLMPQPNENLMEAVFAIHTARDLGAKKITMVAPYLAYMRQDKRFHPGECVSSHVMAKLLSAADHVIGIDPHLHRIRKLQQIFDCKATSLTADPVFSDYIQKTHPSAIIIGPDWESSQWAKSIADRIGHESIILSKKRYSSTLVRTIIHAEPKHFKGRDVVIVDDIISTGNTMIEPIKQLKKFGAKKITCVTVHGVFTKNALGRLRKLGVGVISTNTIQNPVSKIDIAPLIADAL
jgi:ribose-phosphate pyrophosphokinase